MADRALPSLADASARLAEAGRRFYARGWVLGTSGNFSAVVSRRPVRLAITPSAAHKGLLAASAFLEVDGTGRPTESRPGRPSAETLLHVEIVKLRGAGAVLHTHSVWSTILSEAYASAGGVSISGYEMLKGLAGVKTHEHQEWLPIIENSQDMPALARTVEQTLAKHADAHGFLLRGHGLYTWGDSLAEAKRHVEILEFLLEVIGRTSKTN